MDFVAVPLGKQGGGSARPRARPRNSGARVLHWGFLGNAGTLSAAAGARWPPAGEGLTDQSQLSQAQRLDNKDTVVAPELGVEA